jgi:P27 family predicted phage terminase small subunit
VKGRKPKLVVLAGGAKGAVPGAPDWLPPNAQAEWRRAAPELHARSLLTRDVLATLESYCVAVGQVREYEEIMTAEGRLVATEDGPKPHPAFRMQGAAMREARLLAAELGLTPHRRGERTKDKGNADEWDVDLLA